MKILSLSAENISASITWLVVTGFSLWIMWTSEKYTVLDISVALLLCIIFFTLWCVVVEEEEYDNLLLKKRLPAVILYVVVIAIYFAIPLPFVAIFMVIFSAITRYFMSFKNALLLSPLLALPQYLVYTFYWQQSGAVIDTFLFWTFNIFALVMVNIGLLEREARLEAERTTRQLESTQALLNEAVKQGERVRIARNIHDLLGHHLTALTINLQVASRKSEGEVKDSIEQCHQLARLLLSDVREAVSDIRDKSALNLEASIRSMLDKLPKLSLTLDIDNSIHIDDIQIADTIVKTVQESITNTLKHAHGEIISVRLAYANVDHNETILANKNNQEKQLQVDISNDGKMPKSIKQGNGLTGIKERLKALKGNAKFNIDAGKFHTQLLIPVNQHD
jgi:two-component system sensor histidine kinase DesK